MIKPTKRKAFNFLRSYFDVLNELKEDKDKLNFLLSIIDKQFLDKDPEKLNFIVNLCYSSQKHAIESSVKGWIRVNKDTPITDPPTNPPTNPVQEEEKEKVKEKVQLSIDWNRLLEKFNSITGKKSRVVPYVVKKAILARIKEGYTKSDIITAIENCYKDSHHKETNHKYLTLEFISRPAILEKFVSVTPIAKKKAPQYKDDWR